MSLIEDLLQMCYGLFSFSPQKYSEFHTLALPQSVEFHALALMMETKGLKLLEIVFFQ